MIYRVSHKTTYKYADAAMTCQNQVHLTPANRDTQKRLSSDVTIDPAPDYVRTDTDFFGNTVTRFEIDRPHSQLTIHATSRVEVNAPPEAPLDGAPWETVRDKLPTDRSADGLSAYQYAFASRYIPLADAFAAFAAESFTQGRPLLDAALDLTGRINKQFKYDPDATTITTSVEEVLENKHGVCQDFAHFQLAALRSLGLAARYVSGYLRTEPAPGRPKLVGADASHAWIELYAPSVGWVGFDPTNNCLANDTHIIVASGRDYGDVSPIKGVVLGGGEHDLRVSVDVTPE